MGWCSGTETFDVAVDMVLDEQLTPEQKVEKLIRAWWQQDWDCEGDSRHFEHPLVRSVLKRLQPGWFDDD